MTMADKIVVMNEGNIEQVGKPLDLYNNPDKNYMMNKIDSIQQAKDDYYEQGEMFEKGGRAGFKLGTVRKMVQAKIDEALEQSPKDTTSALDKLIKKTLNEDLFDKKDRIIDQLISEGVTLIEVKSDRKSVV